MTRTTHEDRDDIEREIKRRRVLQSDNMEFLDVVENLVRDAERLAEMEASE